VREELRPARDYKAPLETQVRRILTPLEDFIRNELASSILMVGCTVLALIMANTALAHIYEEFLHIHITLVLGPWTLDATVHHWINDGLMAFFFFVVGLEIKREMLVGELAGVRKAALPMIAALGGMVVPAGLYALLNSDGPGSPGWGVPMATDIAFAVGAITLLGSRVPRGLLTFLLALAIVDDLGAVMVIAVFYTETLNTTALGMCGVFLMVLILLNLSGIRSMLPHFIVSVGLWLAMYHSGVHATVAGVLAAWTVPIRPRLETHNFIDYARSLIDRFDSLDNRDVPIMHNPGQREMVLTLEDGSRWVQSPVQRLEHAMHVPVAFVIIPIFALANAGVPIAFDRLDEVFTDPITIGVMLGLVVGKVIGIAGSVWIAIKLGIGQLPRGAKPSDMVGIGFLGGIGFTMSIFVAELAFRDNADLLVLAKTGILAASLTAAVMGFMWLRMTCKLPSEVASTESAA